MNTALWSYNWSLNENMNRSNDKTENQFPSQQKRFVGDGWCFKCSHRIELLLEAFHKMNLNPCPLLLAFPVPPCLWDKRKHIYLTLEFPNTQYPAFVSALHFSRVLPCSCPLLIHFSASDLAPLIFSDTSVLNHYSVSYRLGKLKPGRLEGREKKLKLFLYV